MNAYGSKALRFGFYHREILNDALRVAAQPLAELELTPSQVNVLNVIASFPGASGTYIADINSTSPQAVARILRPLVKKGWVHRTAGQAATFCHYITDIGRNRLHSGLQIAAKQNQELLNVLTIEETDELLRILGKLHAVRARKTPDEVSRLTASPYSHDAERPHISKA